MEKTITKPTCKHERYDYLMNHFAELKNKVKNKENNIHEIKDVTVSRAFEHHGYVKLIIDKDAREVNSDNSITTTNTIWVDYYNILELLSFNIFTMNYIEYIGANRERAINTLLTNCTIDIVQEFETPDFAQWNAYRFLSYTIHHRRFFNHVTKIQLSNKSIGLFNDMMKLDM